MRSFEHRLTHLEQSVKRSSGVVPLFIEAGRYYDSLTESDKEQYAAYYNTNRLILEESESAVHGNLHFMLAKRPQISTSIQEYKTLVREIEDIIFKEQE